MSIRDDVVRHRKRLADEQRADKSRGSAFEPKDPRWMDGKVLFNAEALEKARRYEDDKYLDVLGVFDQVEIILVDLKEPLLIAGIIHDRQLRCVIILTLRKD